MGPCGSGVECGVMVWVKRNMLMWFGHGETEHNNVRNEETVRGQLMT